MKIIARPKTIHKLNELIKCNESITYMYGIKHKKSRKRYVGIRTKFDRLNQDPRKDLMTDYFTSSTCDEFKSQLLSNPFDFSYFIYYVSSSAIEISDLEQQVLTKNDAITNDRFINKSNGGGFSTAGIVIAKSINGDILLVKQSDYKNRSDLKSVMSNTIVVTDKQTNNKMRISVDEYNLNKERYDHHMNGRLRVINKFTGVPLWVSKEEYSKNKELYDKPSKGHKVVNDPSVGKNILVKIDDNRFESPNKGFLTVYDEIEKTNKRIHSSEYDKSKHRNYASGTVYVKTLTDDVIAITCDEYYKNKDKYQLAKGDKNLKVFSIKRKDWETISDNDFDSDDHITSRTRFIKVFIDDELVDVFRVKDIKKRYSHLKNINVNKMTNMYKNNRTFKYNNRILKAVKSTTITTEDIEHFLKFRETEVTFID